MRQENKHWKRRRPGSVLDTPEPPCNSQDGIKPPNEPRADMGGISLDPEPIPDQDENRSPEDDLGSRSPECKERNQEFRRASTRRRRSGTVIRKKRIRRSCPTDPLEASLRFHLELLGEGPHPIRSVRIRKSTTVADIWPALREKFGLHADSGELRIVSVTDFGEKPLSHTDRPLELLLNSDHAPRFVVKASQRVARTVAPPGPRPNDVHHRGGHTQDYPTLTRVPCRALSNIEHGVPLLDTRAIDGTGPVPEERKTHTPDLLGGCRQQAKPPLPDYLTASLQSWSRSPHKARMAASDSKLDAILDHMSDSNASVYDGMAPDTSRGRKKLTYGKSKRRRSRSRETSVEGRDGEFKPASKRGSSLRSSKSMTNLFQKTFSLRKKENPFRPNTELSTEETSPGVLKIFGDSVSPGANYKSVLAVSTSTAKELVKEAVERYGMSRKKSALFVLCDVIGHFMNYSSDVACSDALYSLSADHGLWTEECIRIIGDNERPLVLQKYWKPTDGYARRFELRKRSDLMVFEDQDTSGVNANARRMLTSKGRSEVEIPQNAHQRESDASSHRGTLPRTNGMTTKAPALQQMDHSAQESGKCSDTPYSRPMAPTDYPYLLNVAGYNPEIDCLVYPINSRCVKVGSDQTFVSGKNICLTAPDVLDYQGEFRVSSKVEKGEKSVLVEVIPREGAHVSVNGTTISGPVQLKNGDMLNFGNFYVFVYKDPCAQPGDPRDRSVQKSTSNMILQSKQPTPASPPRSSAVDDESSVITNSSNETYPAAEWRKQKNQEYEHDKKRLKLSYSLEKEDDLLQMIVNIADERPGLFRLTPAYLLSMMVEYSAAKYDQICTRALLLKLSTKIHNNVLRRARCLAEKQSSFSNESQPTTETLIADLCPTIQWMTNALELLHHFRLHLSDYLMDPQVSLSSRTRASIATAGDEVIRTLEEVVMYTFQQTVYYLTKAMYSCLPALMDSNPFHDDSLPNPASDRPSTDHVLNVYQITLEYLRENKLHSKIVSQLFCYLFFFTSTSVFNNLMTKGTSEKYFRWSRGVQLRGNLDSLEAWAVTNDLNTEATEYLRKITCLVNLLATPKVQLLRSPWSDLRQLFPDLNPAQLQHVLAHYEDGRHRDTAAWQPDPRDLQDLQKVDLMESFNSHPPLEFPSGGFHMNLAVDSKDMEFHKLLRAINVTYGGKQVNNVSTVSEMKTSDIFGEDRHADPKMQSRAQPDGRSHSRMNCTSEQDPWSTKDFQPRDCEVSADHVQRVRRISTTSEKAERGLHLGAERLDDNNNSSSSLIRRSVPPASSSCDPDLEPTRDDVFKRCARSVDSCSDQKSSSCSVRRHRRRSYSPSEHGRSFRFVSGLGTSDNHQHGGHVDDPTEAAYLEAVRRGTEICAQRSSFHEDSFGSHKSNNGDSFRGRSNSIQSGSPASDQLYMNVPIDRKRPNNNSLNSSISSQASRDGREVYHYLRGTLSNNSQIPPEPENTAPVLSNDNQCHLPLNSHQWNQRAPVHIQPEASQEKEIFVDNFVPSDNQNLRVLPVISQSHREGVQGVGSSVVSPPHMSAFRPSVPSNPAPSPRQLSGHLHQHGEQLLKKDMFAVEIRKGPMGYGMGLIDGMHTSLRRPGIYVRTLVDGSPARLAGRLKLGDRLLAVNGSSVIGTDYSSVMSMLKEATENVQLTVSRSDAMVAMHITATPC